MRTLPLHQLTGRRISHSTGIGRSTWLVRSLTHVRSFKPSSTVHRRAQMSDQLSTSTMHRQGAIQQGQGLCKVGRRIGKRARKHLRQQAVACNAALAASDSRRHGHQQHNGTGRSEASSAAAMHLQGPGYSKKAKQRCKQHKPAPQNSVPSASMPTDASAPAQAPAQHGQRTQSDASAKREASALEAGKVQEAAKPEMKNKFAQRLKARPYKKSVASVNASGSAPASLHGISQAAPTGVTAPVPVADLVVHG